MAPVPYEARFDLGTVEPGATDSVFGGPIEIAPADRDFSVVLPGFDETRFGFAAIDAGTPNCIVVAAQRPVDVRAGDRQGARDSLFIDAARQRHRLL
jgi:hypothetical protein